MAATRLTPLVGRWLTAILVVALAADAALGFFPSLPPTNRVLPTGGTNGGPTPPTSRTPPTSPTPPTVPSTQSVTPGGPPSSTPPGGQGPPVVPVITPSGGITPTPPGPIPEISAHGVAAGLALTVCGIFMLTDRKRKSKSTPAMPRR